MSVFIPTADGRWVDENFARLAEIIKDYDSKLELRWIAPEHRVSVTDKHRPYCVVDTRPPEHVILYASELDPPVATLERLFRADNNRTNVLKDMTAHNAAVQAFELKKRMDDMEAARDFSAFVIKNERNYWKHGGKKYDDKFREIK